MLSSLFLSATNHLLAQAGWARQRLQGHAGRTARLELAPVAEIDPWGAMAMAVHRSGDERGPWTPSERLTPEQALAASVDGASPVSVGALGDVALLDRDPLARTFDVDTDDGEGSAAAAEWLESVNVVATVRAGEVVYRA